MKFWEVIFMICKYHPEEEGVVTCAKCGVSLCKKCEEDALFRTNNGNGQAFCKRCSLEEAQAIVDFDEKWLKKRELKLKIMGGVIAIGFIAGLLTFSFSTIITSIFFAGFIASSGLEPAPKSIESQVYDAGMKLYNPISYFTGNFIGKTIAAPIVAVGCYIGYKRTKEQYKNDLANLELAKMRMIEE